ncbi:pentapeptide repeat-containing protein [Streptomyces sp. NBC_01525]|uniref:Pentapeptide repeat-containing protein n=1 Tax=Streptomyces benahoarensis TaxID=2595054 RepID=A0A553Z6B9_9ACTN|nr:pentapeptide repeat-containing protein [Streptomyces benahoarensis]TSB36979.1 pentapeptide repeat-containing protein [Streptomyces benahoarensis]
MAGRRTGTVRAVRRAEVRLPELAAYDGGELEPEGDYDGLEFTDVDAAGQSARGARFMDCALRRCALDETELNRARFIDTVLTGIRGVGTDLSQASLRDVEVTDARLGGTQLHGAVLERVVVRGGKIDFPNLRTAKLRDVVFEGCVLVEPDFSGAELERVTFEDCTVARADFTGARMKDVDLRGAAALDVTRGIDSLAGAVISPAQLLDLAPSFAAQLGVRVE